MDNRNGFCTDCMANTMISEETRCRACGGGRVILGGREAPAQALRWRGDVPRVEDNMPRMRPQRMEASR